MIRVEGEAWYRRVKSTILGYLWSAFGFACLGGNSISQSLRAGTIRLVSDHLFAVVQVALYVLGRKGLKRLGDQG